MAKVAFNKLNIIKSIPNKTITIGENVIEVKQYLGLVDKIDLMTHVAEQAGDEMGFFNIVKIKTFYIIEMIKAYTNISFTEKQLEDIAAKYGYKDFTWVPTGCVIATHAGPGAFGVGGFRTE